MNARKLWAIAFGFALIIGRLFVHPSHPTIADVYKDVAHLFIGGLFVAWLLQRQPWQKVLFWALCAWEVFVAIGSRFIWAVLTLIILSCPSYGMGWLRPDKTYHPPVATNTTSAVTNAPPPVVVVSNVPPASGPRLISVVADGEFYIKWKVEGIGHWKNTAKGINAEIIVNGVFVENIREGYTRQHLKNAYGTGEHSVRGINKGDTVEIYFRRIGTRERTTSVPFVWPWKGTAP